MAAIQDSLQTSHYSKAVYWLWRPETAIAHADRTCIGTGASRTLAKVLGNDAQTFTATGYLADEPLDDLRQFLVEPALQHRPQELADKVFKRARLNPHRKLFRAPAIALDRGELREGSRRGIRNNPFAGL